MPKVEVKQIYKYPLESVFDSFLSVDSAQMFMFRTENGRLISAEVNPELGGEFVFIEKRGEIKAAHYGTFVEIDKPEKISFAFAVEKDSPESSFVEVYFQKVASGCQVKVIQELEPENEKYLDRVEMGWTTVLEQLENFLASVEVARVTTSSPKDSQGQELCEGDSVKTIKDLKVKGSSMVIKRGTVAKKIQLMFGNETEVGCKVDGVALNLETQWLLKVQ